MTSWLKRFEKNSNFAKKFGCGEPLDSCCFVGFLRGVLLKVGVLSWCFDGVIVVGCVVEMVFWQRVFGH
jgi:hypothetical protein